MFSKYDHRRNPVKYCDVKVMYFTLKNTSMSNTKQLIIITKINDPDETTQIPEYYKKGPDT